METVSQPSWLNILPDGTPEAWIYQEIGPWGISAQAFVDALRPYKGKAVSVRLNCYGGNVIDGIAIYSFLKECDATIYVDGIAASMASVILMAGKKRIMGDNTFVMIHSPSGDAWGLTADEMRDSADMLDKLKGSLLKAYVDATGQSEKTVEKWMEGDTWMTADECLENGICTEITEGMRYAAMLGKLRNPPAALVKAISNNERRAIMTEPKKKDEPKPTVVEAKAVATPAVTTPEVKPDPTATRLEVLETSLQDLTTKLDTILGAVAKIATVETAVAKISAIETAVAKLGEDATARVNAVASAQALNIVASQGAAPVAASQQNKTPAGFGAKARVAAIMKGEVL